MRNLLITGAANGIGNAVAQSIDQSLFRNIVLVDHSPIDGLEGILTYQVDITSEDQVNKLFLELENKDILITDAVNAAGIPGANRPFALTKISDFENVMNVNFFGNVKMMMQELRMMEMARKGRVINIASVLARCGMTGSSSYAASKGALVALTKSLAIEYAQKNIQLNTLSPGAVDTNFIGLLKKRMGGVDSLADIHPVKRVSTPSEIAQYINFLLEKDTSFLTGVDIPIDGGYSAQ